MAGTHAWSCAFRVRKNGANGAPGAEAPAAAGAYNRPGSETGLVAGDVTTGPQHASPALDEFPFPGERGPAAARACPGRQPPGNDPVPIVANPEENS